MWAALAVVIAITALSSTSEARRISSASLPPLQDVPHLHNIIASFQEFNTSGTLKLQAREFNERRKAIGGGLQGGDDLPPSICSGSWDEKYVSLRRMTDVEGGYGEIWTAALKESASKTPTKILKKVLYVAGDHEVKKNFDPMELIPSRLNLPFVSRIEGVFHDEGSQRLWIAQPFYSGGDLFNHRAASPTEVLALAKQFAYGLWQIHRSGIIYGDIKPENTFWVNNARRQIVLADFGLATPCVTPENGCSSRFRGTYEYMAPNIVSKFSEYRGKHPELDNPYGFEVDWWAFGMMLMEWTRSNCYIRLSSGRVVPQATMEAILNGDCKFSKTAKILKREYADLDKLVNRINTKTSYVRHLMHDDARIMMQSADPADHPILSDPYFFKKDEISKGWNGVCMQYYTEDECTRTPSLGSACEVESSQNPSEEEDQQQTLIDALNSARDRAQQKLSSTCEDACSPEAWAWHFDGNQTKAEEKMADACEFVMAGAHDLGSSSLFQKMRPVAECNELGESHESPERHCCQCLLSPVCQRSSMCLRGSCA
eukprot:gnl/MRDRNA2_/MRDRNA2_73370_c0_seq1.p1 gnl/MRDRNA2_/MRDRNA2_73370_c0~~gnl/MRDRNA2_/MRDRNA2_73370_c0_seq1.p1  ORF type:complete len:543 (+),score=85.16 gnl/MRDRNA2_/MRDRNA2_73370_c0_seq1:101-1729(+)